MDKNEKKGEILNDFLSDFFFRCNSIEDFILILNKFKKKLNEQNLGNILFAKTTVDKLSNIEKINFIKNILKVKDKEHYNLTRIVILEEDYFIDSYHKAFSPSSRPSVSTRLSSSPVPAPAPAPVPAPAPAPAFAPAEDMMRYVNKGRIIKYIHFVNDYRLLKRGIKNPRFMCYMNSSIQLLSNIPEFLYMLYVLEDVEITFSNNERDNMGFINLRKIIRYIYKLSNDINLEFNNGTTNTHENINILTNLEKYKEQQMVSEFMYYLFKKLEDQEQINFTVRVRINNFLDKIRQINHTTNICVTTLSESKNPDEKQYICRITDVSHGLQHFVHQREEQYDTGLRNCDADREDDSKNAPLICEYSPSNLSGKEIKNYKEQDYFTDESKKDYINKYMLQQDGKTIYKIIGFDSKNTPIYKQCSFRKNLLRINIEFSKYIIFECVKNTAIPIFIPILDIIGSMPKRYILDSVISFDGEIDELGGAYGGHYTYFSIGLDGTTNGQKISDNDIDYDFVSIPKPVVALYREDIPESHYPEDMPAAYGGYNLNYKNKYLKYKTKYLKLKNSR